VSGAEISRSTQRKRLVAGIALSLRWFASRYLSAYGDVMGRQVVCVGGYGARQSGNHLVAIVNPRERSACRDRERYRKSSVSAALSNAIWCQSENIYDDRPETSRIHSRRREQTNIPVGER
jgi:hypothetical protein